MFTSEEIKMIAPCGIYCGGCPVLTCQNNPDLQEALKKRGLNPELIPCQGCRTNKGICAFHEGECATYQCVKTKGVDFCFECDSFPCEKLYPCADRAEVLPHNMKVLNLAFIQKHGIAAWLEKQGDMAIRYYKGKMSIGRGPQL
jgi:hypothetical protein